jgi:peptide/nickel transport system permease protein
MWRFVARRVFAAILLLWLVLTGTFFLVHLAPGEPSRFYRSESLTIEAREHLRRLYGLDRPLPEQYLTFMSAVSRGDWGDSLSFARPAKDLLIERLPPTLLLVAVGCLIEHLLGIGAGLICALRPGTRLDRGLMTCFLIFQSIPIFILGLLAIELLAIRWPIFPAQQMSSLDAATWPFFHRSLDLLAHLALPASVLGLTRALGALRFTRNGLLEVLRQDYIRAARARGLSETRVFLRHALPNALSPLIQRLGTNLPTVLAGTAIIEAIFAWPGLGLLSMNAVLQRDYSLILAATALFASFAILGSLLADLAHALLDPRVRDLHG